jgi:hypothetical protein
VVVEPLTQQPIAAFIRAHVRYRHASTTRFQRNHIACAELFPIRGTGKHVRSVKSIESISFCRCAVERKPNCETAGKSLPQMSEGRKRLTIEYLSHKSFPGEFRENDAPPFDEAHCHKDVPQSRETPAHACHTGHSGLMKIGTEFQALRNNRTFHIATSRRVDNGASRSCGESNISIRDNLIWTGRIAIALATIK